MRRLPLLAWLLLLLSAARADPPEMPPRPINPCQQTRTDRPEVPPQPISSCQQIRPRRNRARRLRAQGRALPAPYHPPPPRPVPRIIEEGAWLPEVRQALDRLISEQGSGSPGYSAADPPVAVIAWDVAAAHDAGEALFYRLVTLAQFKFDRGFWDLIPVVYGRERIRSGYRAFSPLPRAVWARQPEYWIYRKAFFGCYQAICREQGKAACARWLAVLLSGMEESEAKKLAAETVAQGLQGRSGVESEAASAEDPSPVKVHVGLRPIPEMADLFLKLKQHGFDVWVLDASNQWSLEAYSAAYGVHPTRAAGIRLKTSEGRVTGEVLEPVPWGPGRAEAAAEFVGEPVALIIGNAEDDELLKFGSGLRIKIAAPDRQTGFEKEWGWLVQPPFPGS